MTVLALLCSATAPAQKTDSLPHRSDSLRFPLHDRRGDRFSAQNRNPFDLQDTAYIKQRIEYDPLTKQYYIIEKIGNSYYRKPTYLTFDEFYRLQSQQSESDYFKQRAAALTLLNQKTTRPKTHVYDKLFDRVFGTGPNGLKVDIRPQGSVDILAGYQGQNTLNPTLPESARKTGGFDFDMNANLNVIANIGDKLRLPINYNTLATYDYLNQLKLNYKGMDDELLKSVEAGNISFQSKGTLIASAQNLFGIKAQLQFGKLTVTAALANQRSQTQNQTLSGGAAVTTFQKKLSDYDENRHFLMAQYFHDNFKSAMSKLPVVNSQVQILRTEVWVTNRTGATIDTRYIAAFMDLGENKPFNPAISSLTTNPLPANGANSLYQALENNPSARDPALITGVLQGNGLTPVVDYEKTFARKLAPSEYYFNPQVGFVSLNSSLQTDDVLAVAYQYSYNGRTFQVGEFSQDVALDTTQGVQKVLFLKLLKATSARTNLPTWNLMMKNVYSLDLSSISKDGFQLNVLYQQPSGGNNPYLPESSPAASGRTFLQLLNLDRLNSHNDPQPDGVFDYVEGFTVLSNLGRVIFPELQPFGRDLDTVAFTGQPAATRQKYIFNQLYDSIKAIAQTYANVDRFIMSGRAKGIAGGDISLGAFNIPRGSVRVTAGAQVLTEGVDYSVDYNLGTVKILNQAIINSNIPVNATFENNSAVSTQQRGFTAIRLDYAANKKLAIGATLERLTERPFFTKVNYSEDPIRNTMYGVDFSYKSDLPGLTRLLNRLPFYNTKAKSSITAYGEGAYFQPGHPPQIGSGSDGLIYMDDFEGASSNIDLRFPLVSWALASTPQGNGLFPEGSLTDSVDYGKNRAKLAWYNIEPNIQDKTATNNPLRGNLNELSDPRVRQVYTNELFPLQSNNITNSQTSTFDLAFYPTDPGPYNFESSAAQIDANGKLRNPTTRWGGLMRAIDQPDFETNNVGVIEFWIQDPFIKTPNSTGGQLRINLGNVSEDILKDGKRFYENGLSTPTSPAPVDSSSTWGKTPINPTQVTNAFSNDPSERVFQDVGFDGLDNDGERRKRAAYLQRVAANFGTNSPFYIRASNDPSNDDYVWYRDGLFDKLGTGILGRYKNYNNPQGNSPVATGTGEFSPAATLYPDNEDLNRDNTLNETEAYYEYEVDMKPGMDVGLTKYITDKRVVPVNYANGTSGNENWFLFRVPIKDFVQNVGNVPDFKSIRFIRMYMTGWSDSVVLRFAKLDLVHDQWRQFTYKVDTTGSYTPADLSNFNLLSVNLEENSNRVPVNYVIPPGIQRVQVLSNNGVNLLQNEQSLSMQVTNLVDGDTKAIFKAFNFDLRKFGKLSMFAHAESILKALPVTDNQLNLVVRIGQDYLNNYYEIKIPLKVTPFGTYNDLQDTIVWPTLNNLNVNLQDLVTLKQQRNSAAVSLANIYRQPYQNGQTISVLGDPNLGQLGGVLIGVENAKDGNTNQLSAEVWVDELRLSDIDEHGGYAALGRVDVNFADIGKVSVSANTYTQGFGTLESHINDRAKDNMTQIDASLNLDAGKLLPRQARLSIPVYAGINRTVHLPEFDPYDLDIKLQDKINAAKTVGQKDSIRNAAKDQTTITTLNLTNVHIAPKGKINIFSLSNFDVSYSYTQTNHSDPEVLNNSITKWRANVGYTYVAQPKFIEPFKKLIKSRSPWYGLLRDFNFNLRPSLISFRADVNRQYGIYTPRIINTELTSSKVLFVDTTYDKYFTFDRYYKLRWDLVKSINLDFSAVNYAVVDEPFGALNTKDKRDSVIKNFFNGGRNVSYQQQATASYTFPLSKIPITDWINLRFVYGTTYAWTAASQVEPTLGNILENSQDNKLSGQFDFTRLYAKSRWLREANSIAKPKPPLPALPPRSTPANGKILPGQPPSPQQNILGTTIPERSEVIKGLHGKKKREALRKWRQQKRDLKLAQKLQHDNQRQQQQEPIGDFAKAAGRILTMVKSASVDYQETYHSRLPGYLDSTKILGQDFKSMQPGLDYVFGRQPDSNWLNSKAAQGLITRDPIFSDLFRQNFTQKLSITAQLEPIRELRIDLNLDKSFSKEYSELFKDTLNNGSRLQHLSPYADGGFSVSYISFGTLFKTSNPNEVSSTFHNFEDNRIIISGRVAAQNPYWQALPQKFGADGYATGYGRYSQNVLIPAFIAAYTNISPYKVALLGENNTTIKNNPFAGILPKPNWRISYTGLSKIPALAAIFSSVRITHAYSGNLSMNSFTSALNYQDPLRNGAPGFIDTVSGNFIPFFLVPNITMQEQFTPLIGIDVTTTKQMNIQLEYKKARILSLSLIDYQMSETNSTEWNIGFSLKKRGIQLPFRLPGSLTGKSKLQNDLTLKLVLGMRNDAMSNSRLDQSNAYGTGGQRVYTIQPSIDYVYNSRINLKLYFDQRRSTPYISTSAPTIITRAGLQVRISLAP